MARVIFPAGNTGEAKAYILALTSATDVKIPTAPSPADLGQILKVESKLVSVNASTDIGFGWGSLSGGASASVLLQDYWYLKEVYDDSNPAVNSWTFAAGFRVGIRIVGFNAKLDVGIGMLAAKAEIENLNVTLQVLRVGMPDGPDVPVDLAAPSALDVDKFAALKVWEQEVIDYVKDNKQALDPVLVSASVNVSGERLIDHAPGVRFAMWRISHGTHLRRALEVASEKEPAVAQAEIRAVYAAVFGDSSMLVPGRPSETRKPGRPEKDAADDWLHRFRDA